MENKFKCEGLCGEKKFATSDFFYFNSKLKAFNKVCIECFNQGIFRNQTNHFKATHNDKKLENIFVAYSELQKNSSTKEENLANDKLVNSIDFSKLEEHYGQFFAEKFKLFLLREEQQNANTTSILCVDKEELAEKLGISMSYINKLMSEGEIPYEKIGRAVRFRILDIETWLQKRKRP